MNAAHPLAALRHHVTGAVERGEAQAIEGKPMRQQVNVTAALTYDCDARLGADALHRAIMADITRLHCPVELPNECRREAELIGRSITTLHEEAAIYGTDEAAPTIQQHTIEALRKAMAEAPRDPLTGAAFVNIDTRILALLLPN